jgi:hypothetical protein
VCEFFFFSISSFRREIEDAEQNATGTIEAFADSGAERERDEGNG